jgi:hypothetical protein
MIADGFPKIDEFILQPPCRRAKPKKCHVETGQQLQKKISLKNMRAFVGQNHLQLSGVPVVE